MNMYEKTEYNRAPHQAAVVLRPTPVNELIPPSRVENQEIPYSTDVNGQLRIESRPGCLSIIFMLPYPFFCGGCCYSVSSNIVFNDSTQTFNIETWPGYLWCFVKSRSHVEYSQIGNVALEESCCQQNNRSVFFPLIVLKDGTKFYIGDSDSMSSVQHKVLALHHFLFGRSDPNYVPPDPSSLIIR